MLRTLPNVIRRRHQQRGMEALLRLPSKKGTLSWNSAAGPDADGWPTSYLTVCVMKVGTSPGKLAR
jgi:hypothetical protein